MIRREIAGAQESGDDTRMRASRRPIAAVAALGHLLASTLLVLPPGAFAQVGDTDPPRIEFEPVERGTAGDTQVVSAGITDDVDVESVTLHYRLDPEGPYTSVPMEPLAATDIHSASVQTAGTGAEVLQYYIEARDGAGNRSIRGFAFDPLERRLVESDAPALAEAPSAEVPEPGLSTGQKVLYGVLGVIAVGALAAAAGGSSGGGDGPRADEPGGNDIPLNVTVEPVQ